MAKRNKETPLGIHQAVNRNEFEAGLGSCPLLVVHIIGEKSGIVKHRLDQHRRAHSGLVLSPAKKWALAQLAGAGGGLSQAAILRYLPCQAARELGLWPPTASH